MFEEISRNIPILSDFHVYMVHSYILYEAWFLKISRRKNWKFGSLESFYEPFFMQQLNRLVVSKIDTKKWLLFSESKIFCVQIFKIYFADGFENVSCWWSIQRFWRYSDAFNNTYTVIKILGKFKRIFLKILPRG